MLSVGITKRIRGSEEPEILKNLIKQKKSFSLMSIVKHCHRMSREAEESPALKIFKT